MPAIIETSTKRREEEGERAPAGERERVGYAARMRVRYRNSDFTGGNSRSNVEAQSS